jgi:hypothetical protein
MVGWLGGDFMLQEQPVVAVARTSAINRAVVMAAP